MTAQDRGLAALGLDGVPALRPLTYPGLPVTVPSLLTGAELLPLLARRGGLGAWTVDGSHRPHPALDNVLMSGVKEANIRHVPGASVAR
ncbi:hypothetical protein ABZ369_16295, partial [Streptomyces sp. NPDC005918]